MAKQSSKDKSEDWMPEIVVVGAAVIIVGVSIFLATNQYMEWMQNVALGEKFRGHIIDLFNGKPLSDEDAIFVAGYVAQ